MSNYPPVTKSLRGHAAGPLASEPAGSVVRPRRPDEVEDLLQALPEREDLQQLYERKVPLQQIVRLMGHRVDRGRIRQLLGSEDPQGEVRRMLGLV